VGDFSWKSDAMVLGKRVARAYIRGFELTIIEAY